VCRSNGETIFTARPRAWPIHAVVAGSSLTRASSKYPYGLSSSGSRAPSTTTGSPPAASIRMSRDVPERGRPVTTVMNGRVIRVGAGRAAV